MHTSRFNVPGFSRVSVIHHFLDFAGRKNPWG